MMRPTPHQNYPRGGYSLEGKENRPTVSKKLMKHVENSGARVREAVNVGSILLMARLVVFIGLISKFSTAK